MLCALFSVSICVFCFLLWAASYDGLMPSLAACHCNNWYVYVMYMYLVNKLSLSLHWRCISKFQSKDRQHTADALPPTCMARSCSHVQLVSSCVERMNVMWTPRERCTAEQSMHTNTPYVTLAHVGFIEPQSKHCWTRPQSHRVHYRSFGNTTDSAKLARWQTRKIPNIINTKFQNNVIFQKTDPLFIYNITLYLSFCHPLLTNNAYGRTNTNVNKHWVTVTIY